MSGWFVVYLLTGCFCVVNSDVHNHQHYTNEFAVEIQGGNEVADLVARELGYDNLGQIGSIDGHYLFVHKEISSRSKRSAPHLHKRLGTDPRVTWVEQQVSMLRVKRGTLSARSEEDRKRDEQFLKYNDPLFRSQWYIHDKKKLDLEVLNVWNKGYTGKGVVVTILDDGIERVHPDLSRNYDPFASTDLNDKDDDPSPRYDPTNENKHGTRCAGEVAMMASNNVCGVGIAYDCKIGGVRMLDGSVTDRVEAEALSFNHTYVDIYSASWGPNDDGKTVEGPGKLCKAAMEKGIKEGRGGKGVLYVWASGNGGRKNDDCDCDGYTSSIYSLSFSSSSSTAKSPWYTEKCASTMGTTFSSGAYGEPEVISTDLHGKCTDKHTGTSAAAPLAAGVLALVLEANHNLTWRDVQHLVAFTSNPYSFIDEPGWKVNGAGFKVNSRFGFGLMDAAALVDNALKWKTVPEKAICTVIPRSHQTSTLPITFTGTEIIEIETSGCKGLPNEINALEHVQLNMSMTYKNRGRLTITLTSPAGTTTTLLSVRRNDKSNAGFQNWVFMSVHTWGENPSGTWQLTIEDKKISKRFQSKDDEVTITSLELILHGTKDQPDHMKATGGKKVYTKQGIQEKTNLAKTNKRTLDIHFGEEEIDDLFPLYS